MSEKRIPKRFREREAVIYRAFCEGQFDQSEAALREFFAHESTGTPCSECNGYLVGKQRLQLSMDMWEEDILKGRLSLREILEDPEFVAIPGFIETFIQPRIDKIVNRCVQANRAFGVGKFVQECRS